MTEEIIIDGVNVAGCVQLVEEPFYPCGLGGECKGWENCYYKQLKRLEQENKELKIYIESNKQQVEEVETLVMDNDRLLNENNKYKSALEKIREQVNKLIENKGYAEKEEDIIMQIFERLER